MLKFLLSMLLWCAIARVVDEETSDSSRELSLSWLDPSVEIPQTAADVLVPDAVRTSSNIHQIESMAFDLSCSPRKF